MNIEIKTLVDELNKQFEGYNKLLGEGKQEIDELREVVTKQGETITKLKTMPGAGLPVKRVDMIKQALEQNKIADLKKGESRTFEIKAITGASMVAGDDLVALPFREVEIDKAARNMPFVQNLIPWGSTSSSTIDWLEQTTKTDSSATRAENDVIAEGNLGYTEKSVKVKGLAEMIKVTEESLRDYSFLASEINTELMNDLNLLLSDQLLSGTGLTTNIEGLLEKAQAFAAGDFANAVHNANYLDVIRAAVNQIVVAGKGKFSPNYCLVHPTDLAKMNMTKDTTGQYVLPGWTTDNGIRISGVQIVANTGMTSGDYLIGDFTRAKGFVRDSLEIKTGWEGDDFKYNRVTVRATMRVALRVKAQDELAFVTGDFETDLATIEAGA